MITVIEGVDRDRHPALIDEMFRMRAAVFADRLEWDVTVTNGWEIDRFDAEDPLYLLSVDERTGALQAAVRLLPTTGPNTSLQLTSMSGVTPVSTVGRSMPSTSEPPATIVAPAATASPTQPWTLAVSFWLISEETSVASSRGSPTTRRSAGSRCAR